MKIKLFLLLLLIGRIGYAGDVKVVSDFYAKGGKAYDNGQELSEKILKSGAVLTNDVSKGEVFKVVGGKSKVVFPKNASIDRLTRDFSISLWVKPDTFHSGDVSWIISKRPGWWSSCPFALGFHRDGTINFLAHDKKFQSLNGGSKHKLKKGVWTHITFTAELYGKMILYVNGEPVKSRSMKYPLLSNGEPVQIGYVEGGNFPGGNYKAFNGEVTDLKFFSGVLSAEQVVVNMNGKLKAATAEITDLPRRGVSTNDIPANILNNDVLVCEIDFTQKVPVQKGMFFTGNSLKYGSKKIKGEDEACWIVKGNSAPGVPWGRSIFFVITDPRFKNGEMPVVDIEAEVMQPSWAPCEIWGDTTDGQKRLAPGWGDDKKFETIKISIDNAYFGETETHGKDMSMTSDGYDLRLNGYNEDMCIKSIKIKGYDLTEKPDFARLIKIRDIEPNVFVFTNGKNAFTFEFENLTKKEFKGEYKFIITNYERDEHLYETERSLSIKPRSLTNEKIKFSTEGFPYGVYRAVLTLTHDDEVILEKKINFGVTFAGGIPKAQDGQFLYGLDCMNGSPWKSSRAMEFCDLMGVDIIRGGFDILKYDDATMQKAVDIYNKHQLKTMPMAFPQYNKDAKKRIAQTTKQAKRLEEIARKFPQLYYWELGNEPDLPFFYSGPIDTYYEDMVRYYDGIKAGNPNTVVMNGGLCFHSKIGHERATRLMEIMDPNKFDAHAYHGHGPNEDAERNAYNRSKNLAIKLGKGDKPYIETESGVAAKTVGQKYMQAATCIQKMVFAQSVGDIPVLIWFRLIMNREDYGNLIGDQQPEPVILSYRAMTATLKHLVYQSMLSFENKNIQAYFFAGDKDRNALVLWSKKAGNLDVMLELPKECKNVKYTDMFGNPLEFKQISDTTVQVGFSKNPVFLSWTSKTLAEPVVIPSLVDLSVTPTFVPGTETEIALNIYNPTDKEVTTTVNLENYTSVDLVFAENGKSYVVPAKSILETKIGVKVKGNRESIIYEGWITFADVDTVPTDITSIPATLKDVNGNDVKGVAIKAVNNTINIEKSGVIHKKSRPSVSFANIYSDKDQAVTMGGSADWWMSWYVNGKPVFDTLEGGNGGPQGVDTHTFDVDLKKGHNLVAVQVLSGTDGWKLTFGSPENLTRMKDDKPLGDYLLVNATNSEGMSLEKALFVDVVPSMTKLKNTADAIDSLDYWTSVVPMAYVADVENFHDKFPDTLRWWHGADDLSATVWCNTSADYMYIAVFVNDDDIVAKDGDGDKVDSVDVILTCEGVAKEYNVSRIESKNNKSFYMLKVEKPKTNTCEVEITIHDNDNGLYKQKAVWKKLFFVN